MIPTWEKSRVDSDLPRARAETTHARRAARENPEPRATLPVRVVGTSGRLVKESSREELTERPSMRCTAIACLTVYAQAVFALDNGLGALPCVLYTTLPSFYSPNVKR